MSRIGNQIIVLPKGVEVTVTDGVVKVKGPKGQLEQELRKEVEVKVENGELSVVLAPKFQKSSNFHGLFRALINNMVLGVTDGFTKVLEMHGVGYRAVVKGTVIELQVGFSNPVAVPIHDGLTVKVEKNTVVTITGINKQKVGQFAADVRSKRPPEPYKGKGIRYRGEYIRRKAGKAAKA